jgi:S-formylglutathione hydrolase
MKFRQLNILKTVCSVAFTWILVVSAADSLLSQRKAPPLRAGTMQHIKVHGKSLEGNLQGETADPDVSVYLPPGYDTDGTRRYPVVYLLHGYGGTDSTWTGRIANVPELMNRGVANKTAREMIIVMPNSYTKHGGSMYSNSVTTGDWEGYIAEDLVSYMDSHYRTIPDRMSRGIAGHSMGGLGAVRIAMKRPDVFSSMYNMSACCLFSNPIPQPQTNRGDGNRDEGTRGQGTKGGSLINTNLARAAAWSPNPNNPPDYFDLPVKDGQPQPLIVAKWYANMPLVMVDQYVPNLKKYHALAGDVGLQDTLLTLNKELHDALTRFGIAYKFETYEGDHTSKIAERMETKVFPFFSENLSFVPPKKR